MEFYIEANWWPGVKIYILQFTVVQTTVNAPILAAKKLGYIL